MAQLRTWEDGVATLYLTEPRSLVRKEGDTLAVRIPEDRERGTLKRTVRVPLIKVSQVVVYGDVTLTSPALAALLEQGTDICFCSHWGRFRGRLASPLSNRQASVSGSQSTARRRTRAACSRCSMSRPSSTIVRNHLGGGHVILIFRLSCG